MVTAYNLPLDMGFIFGSWPEPPDAVPLHILGLDDRPKGRAEVKAAFRDRVRTAHPDAGDGDGDAVAPLVWARDVLLRKIPETHVTDKHGTSVLPQHPSWTPPPCKVCDGDRINPRTDRPHEVLSSAYGRRRRWVGYCPLCAKDAENARRRDQRRAARSNLPCAVCGQTFTPPRSDAHYCTPACRQAAYRARQETP